MKPCRIGAEGVLWWTVRGRGEGLVNKGSKESSSWSPNTLHLDLYLFKQTNTAGQSAKHLHSYFHGVESGYNNLTRYPQSGDQVEKTVEPEQVGYMGGGVCTWNLVAAWDLVSSWEAGASRFLKTTWSVHFCLERWLGDQVWEERATNLHLELSHILTTDSSNYIVLTVVGQW